MAVLFLIFSITILIFALAGKQNTKDIKAQGSDESFNHWYNNNR